MNFRHFLRLLIPFALATFAGHSGAGTINVPLSEITGQKSAYLKCVTGEFNVSVPIARRWEVKRASIRLRYAVSNNLIGNLSQMSVNLNGYPFTQIKLSPLHPEYAVDIDIPVKLLKNDYNTLSFQVVQHYSQKECEEPCAPDMWTVINLEETFLSIDYEDRPVAAKLSNLTHTFFDPKIFPEASVNIVTEDASDTSLTHAAVVASGIARRFDYRKVRFEFGTAIRPGIDNVIIGRKPFIEKFLGRKKVFRSSEEKGGLLKVIPLPLPDGTEDPARVAILVSGNTLDEVKLGALVIANISLTYPGSDEMVALGFKLPDIAMYSGRQVLTQEKVYDLKTLNVETTTFTGFNSLGREIAFRLPADFLIQQNQFARLRLNFAYGAGMRNNSVLNVTVNGKHLRGILLNKEDGGFFENYGVDIPTYLFKPGANVLRFEPSLNMVGKACETVRLDNLFVTIFDTSTLQFPAMPHRVELPRLELFTLNGFPFTRWPDGYESAVYLPKADAQTISAALNLLGAITQKNGFPPFGTTLTTRKPENWKGELMVVGRIEDLDRELKEASPLRMTRPEVVPYPVIRSWENESTYAYATQISGAAPEFAFITQFESPYQKGRSVIMLASATAAGVLAGSEALLEPEILGALAGDLGLIEITEKKPKLNHLDVGPRYVTGKEGALSPVSGYLASNPNLYYALLALGTLLLAVASYWAVRLLRKRRGQSTDAADKDTAGH
ncbi:MAG: cellulose biosynthesis cyclic di-GMP-binding regulatory protein BcsB [Betaproteobacteria bacterium]|nr:cellulose biosynthesis cyclic di-GMP-binding regulatory protein BcsB [Betaproteobacteria bacterium]